MTAEPTGLDDRVTLLADLEKEARRGPVYKRIKDEGLVEPLLSGGMSRRAAAKQLGVTSTAVGYAVRAIRADRLLAEVREEERRSIRCDGWKLRPHRITEEEVAVDLVGLVFCGECEEKRHRDRKARDQEPARPALYARSGEVVTGSLVTPSSPPAPPPPLIPRPWWEVVRSFLATRRGTTGTICLGWDREPHEVSELDRGDDGYELCSPCRAEAERLSVSAVTQPARV